MWSNREMALKKTDIADVRCYAICSITPLTQVYGVVRSAASYPLQRSGHEGRNSSMNLASCYVHLYLPVTTLYIKVVFIHQLMH